MMRITFEAIDVNELREKLIEAAGRIESLDPESIVGGEIVIADLMHKITEPQSFILLKEANDRVVSLLEDNHALSNRIEELEREGRTYDSPQLLEIHKYATRLEREIAVLRSAANKGDK